MHVCGGFKGCFMMFWREFQRRFRQYHEDLWALRVASRGFKECCCVLEAFRGFQYFFSER